ncbi:MAG: SGNH/GDSL hydrolase family protein [Candidatus Levyibacteriota bacterium]
MSNILVFGTSTTYGSWDSEGGWVQRLRKYIDKKIIESDYKIDYLIYNLGISGDKSTSILKRFKEETEARLDKYGGENIILFHLGVNDSIYNNKQGGLEILPENFRKNFNQLITLAKNYSSKIVIVGSMPVDARVDPMPWSNERSYKNKYVSQFNEIMEEIAKQTNVFFIEIFKKFIEKDYSKLLADGVHMNDLGHKLFFEDVLTYLIDKKIIKVS